MRILKQINTNGSSLIEVLISLLLISLILFALDGEQIYSLKEIKIAYFASLATNQINNAIERLTAIKMNDGFVEQYMQWNLENQQLLPSGSGTITGVFPNYLITVYWGNVSHHCSKQIIGTSGCIRKKIQLA